jgi:hypothetical protein
MLQSQLDCGAIIPSNAADGPHRNFEDLAVSTERNCAPHNKEHAR